MINIKYGIYSKLILIYILAALFLSGCGNRYEEKLKIVHKGTEIDLEYLKTQLDTKQLTNALLIDKYAAELIKLKPDYSDIARLLKKEATTEGKNFSELKKRMANVNLLPKSNAENEESLAELGLISAAADSLEYNNALADVVNTIASLSDGKLAVINVPASKKKSAQKTNALVGNPSYGHWNHTGSGQSFWVWYGMYSMFNNVMGGRNYYYDSWSSRPHYSYYNDYGRNRWGSSSDVSRNYNLSKKYPSKYNKPSTATKNRYAKVSSRSSSYGSSKTKSSSTSSKSSSGSSSRYSSYGSSSRSSSFSSSRSSFSGK